VRIRVSALGTLPLLAIFLAGCLGSSSGRSAATGPAPSSPARLLPLLHYVDPFIGTIHGGNVFPGATVPHGMVQWSPDTSAGGLSMPGGYNYGDPIIRGFSLTHLSGAGCAAFGNIPFMPVTAPVTTPPLPNGSPYSTRFTHADEQASPGYYAVRLASGIGVRLTVTPRTGLGVFTSPGGRDMSLLINPGSSAGATSNVDGARWAAIRIDGHDRISGSATAGSFCHLHNSYTVYFAAQFNRPFSTFGTWDAMTVHPGVRNGDGPHAGGILTFDTSSQRAVLVKVGLSYVSVRDAMANLRAESPGWSFAALRRQATTIWNRALNAIQATGGMPDEERVFYTALYHALLQPTVFSDADGRYMGFDDRVHIATGYTQYANFSGWDIYRSEVPLLSWLWPRATGDMMQSLVADARQGGWLPRWPVANDYTGEMNGDSADPIIAGAYAFGARHFDVHTALRYMLKGASQPGIGPRGYQERPGLGDYLQRGYVVPQSGGWGAASTTLEYAVDDFAIAQLARALGAAAVYRVYMGRAANWRHVFNPATGFVEPRTPSGTFPPSLDPSSMDGFVEGNAWQYTWMVPQDLGGLFAAMGGGQAVSSRLDRFFARLASGPRAPYDWPGNEPDLEVPWEYDFAGGPWRTQAVVRRIMTGLYTASPGGLPGNDDLGTLSSWYVWAAIGLYPEIPGVPGFALGSPLFPHIAITFPDGGQVMIDAPHASAGAPYVHDLQLNRRPYNQAWLPLARLGGNPRLLFHVRSTPSPTWARTGAP